VSAVIIRFSVVSLHTGSVIILLSSYLCAWSASYP